MDTNSKLKQLPKWMLKPSTSSEKQVSSSSGTTGVDSNSVSFRSRLRKTIYCLTEKELYETAKEILLQGGKGDLLEEIKSKKKANETMNPKAIRKHCRKMVVVNKDKISPEKQFKYLLKPNINDKVGELKSCDKVSELKSSDKVSELKSSDKVSERNTSSDQLSERTKIIDIYSDRTKIKRVVNKDSDNVDSNCETGCGPEVKKHKPDLSILDEIFM